MDYTALFLSHLTDVFRVGLLAGLIYTMERTRAQTGLLIPTLAGLVFVAVIIPTTMPVASVDFTSSVVVGLFSNAVIFAVLWGIWSTVRGRLQ